MRSPKERSVMVISVVVTATFPSFTPRTTDRASAKRTKPSS